MSRRRYSAVAAAVMVCVCSAVASGAAGTGATAPPSRAHGVSSSVQLAALVDRHTVPLDQSIELAVTVTWEGQADRYRFGWPETPQTHRLSIVGSRRSAGSWVDDAGQHARQEFTYILRPTDLGEASIGGVRLTYWAATDTGGQGQTLMTLPIKVVVTPPSEPVRRSWGDLFVVVAVAAAGFLLWRYALRRRSRSAEAPTDAVDVGAELVAALRKARVDGDARVFYDAALIALRHGAQKRWGISAERMGARELMDALDRAAATDAEPDELIARVRELLAQIDRRRFAPSRPEEWELDRVEQVIAALVR